MRSAATLSIAAAIAAVMLSGGAKAQTLASADNATRTTYFNPVNAPYVLNSSNVTSLSFVTSKANQVVQLSMSAICGVVQYDVDLSGNQATENQVQAFFVVDGALVAPSGSADILCYSFMLPQVLNYQSLSAAVMQQETKIPTAGVHTLEILLQISPSTNASHLFPVFGQTHVSVSR